MIRALEIVKCKKMQNYLKGNNGTMEYWNNG